MHALYDKIYKVALEEQTDEDKRMADAGGDWFEFERHLKEKSPKTVAALNPAATEDEVRDAESSMRLKFPPEYVKLLKIHNGQNDDIGPLFGRYNFAPLKEVVSTANQYDGDSDDHTADEEKIEQDKEVKKTWWLSGGWIPFAIADNGDALCIDTQPTSEGKVGQVIEFSVKKLERTLVSTHFSNWLSRFIDSQLDEREEKPAKKEEKKDGDKKPAFIAESFDEFKGKRSNDSVDKIWHLYEKFLKDNKNAVLDTLNPPASAKAIADAEEALGFKIPSESATLLKIHNGQKSFVPETFLTPFSFLSIETSVKLGLFRKDPKNNFIKPRTGGKPSGVKPTTWDPNWLVIASGPDGDVVLDMAPAAGGKSGQVLLLKHDDKEIVIINENFRDFFHDCAHRAMGASAPKATEEGKATEEMASNRQETIYDMIIRPLQRENPKLYATFNPPASHSEISSTNAKLGVALPEEYTNFLRCANGQKSVPAFFGKYLWLSLRSTTDLYSAIKTRGADSAKAEADKEIKPVEQSLKWIPFAEDKDGDTLCFDFDPTPEGTVGQVIAVNYTDATRRLVAKSFAEFLEKKYSEK